MHTEGKNFTLQRSLNFHWPNWDIHDFFPMSACRLSERWICIVDLNDKGQGYKRWIWQLCSHTQPIICQNEAPWKMDNVLLYVTDICRQNTTINGWYGYTENLFRSFQSPGVGMLPYHEAASYICSEIQTLDVLDPPEQIFDQTINGITCGANKVALLQLLIYLLMFPFEKNIERHTARAIVS